MKKNSNVYISLYITVLVALFTALLTLATSKLSGKIDANKNIEKMTQILQVAGVEVSEIQDIEHLYNETTEEWIVDKDGNVIATFADGNFLKGNERAFSLAVKQEYYNASAGEDYMLPVFLIRKDDLTGGNVFADSVFVVSTVGKGLWGEISSYIAIADDGNTIMGTVFNHKSETPGLGAEITSESFRNSFIGKKLFDKEGNFKSVDISKFAVNQNDKEELKYHVDAITGATITSKGVSEMFHDCIELYVPFLNKYLK